LVSARFYNIIFNNGVSFKRESQFIKIEISGHSGFGINGTDIVCAGISTLTQTIILSIAQLLKIRQNLLKENGFLKTEILIDNLDQDQISKLKFIIETLLIGLLEINNEYPGSVNIEFVTD